MSLLFSNNYVFKKAVQLPLLIKVKTLKSTFSFTITNVFSFGLTNCYLAVSIHNIFLIIKCKKFYH